MPSNISEVNVKLGFVFDERSLKQVERRLQASGEKLSRLGDALTLSISAPLALLGGSAIKAAGDFEALGLAMRATFAGSGRSAAEADKEIKALFESAKAPGLEFEQAVRASVRLQNVGFAAEDARKIIEQLANAVATTGGTAEDLGEVVNQFSQMIGKGKVFQDDLKIITGRMPIVAKLMKGAFGTTTAEGLNDLGISSKQFVEVLTKELTKLPRVSGGISNAIVNAGSAIKQFLAGIGNEINKAFNIGELSNTFAKKLESIGAAFAGLSDETKRTIVQMGLALVALGPLTKIFGVLKLSIASSLGAWASTLGFLRAIPDVTAKAVAGFNALNTASRAFVVIGIAAALLSIASAMGAFEKEATAAEKVQMSLNSLHKEANESIASEKAAINRLVGVLNDETASRKQKEAALKELKAISPEYFGQLKIENGLVSGLTAAYDGYIQNLLLAAKARKAEARLIEIDEARTAELEKQKKLQEDLAKNAASTQVRRGGFSANETGAFDSGQASRGGAVAAEINASKQLVNQLALEEAALTNIAKAGFDAVKKQNDAAAAKITASSGVAAAIKEESKQAKLLKEVLSDIANVRAQQDLLGAKDIEEEAKAIENGIKRLLDGGFKPTSTAVQNLKKELKGLFEDLKKFENFAPVPGRPIPDNVQRENTPTPDGPKGVEPIPIPDFRDMTREQAKAFAETEEGIKKLSSLWKSSFQESAAAAFNAISQIANNLSQSRKEKELADLEQSGAARLANAAGNAQLEAAIRADLDNKRAQIERKAAKRAKKIALAEAAINTAVGVTKAIASAPPPFNIPAIVAAAAQGAAQIAVIASQAFAKGTKDAPGGLALVGEKGPEIVNIPRHSQVYTANQTKSMLNGGGYGSNVNVSGEFRVAGTDLVLVLERAHSKNQRRF